MHNTGKLTLKYTWDIYINLSLFLSYNKFLPLIGSHDNHMFRDWINRVQVMILASLYIILYIVLVSFFSNAIIPKKCKYRESMWLENTEQPKACRESCGDTAQTTWSYSSVIHQMEMYSFIVHHGSCLCEITLYFVVLGKSLPTCQ